MTDQDNSAASAATTDGGRKRAPTPVFGSVNDLMGLVQAQRTSTANDGARQFTNGGFKTSGGIDSLPVATRGHMAAALILSIASEAQGDGQTEATQVLAIVGEFAGSAQEQAKDAARLAAFENIAKLDNIAGRGEKESVADFMTRIKKHVATQ